MISLIECERLIDVLSPSEAQKEALLEYIITNVFAARVEAVMKRRNFSHDEAIRFEISEAYTELRAEK